MSAGVRLESAQDFVTSGFSFIQSDYENIIINMPVSGTVSGTANEANTGISTGKIVKSAILGETALKDLPINRVKNVQAAVWENDRFLLNKSRRSQAFKERPENAFDLLDDDLVFPTTTNFVVASQANLFAQQVKEFTTYSEAKDYKASLGKSEKLQITTPTTIAIRIANTSVKK